MILHYLKIAWRNLLKYKTQSIISILGLAIGFTVFAFTMSWIRYEKGYDKHNPYADQIYKIVNNDTNSFNNQTSVGLTEYLRSNFPEVFAASNISSSQSIFPDNISMNERSRFVKECRFSVFADTAFFSVFYPEVKFFYPTPLPKQATILVRSIAEKWDITPKKINTFIDSLFITPIAIVNDMPLSSNVAFRYLVVSNPKELEFEVSNLWNFITGYTYIRLHEGSSIENISNKLEDLQITDPDGKVNHYSFNVYPLRKAHYLHPEPDSVSKIKFEAVKQFSVVALLVMICAIINYIMLFISRVKIRIREFDLYKVNGATNNDILQLLFWEFIITLIAAVFLGIILTELLFPIFIKYSMIVVSRSYFLVSVLIYSLIIVLVSALATFTLINKLNNNFTKFALIIQLSIGILLIFCSAVMYNQYDLMDQRVGYNRNNLMVFGENNGDIPISEIKNIAGIGDFITNAENLLRWSNSTRLEQTEIIDKEQKTETYNFQFRSMDNYAREFLEIPLLEGRDMLPDEQAAYFINESGNRILENNAIGKMVIRGNAPIIGVIPDMQIESPLIKIEPTLYYITRSDNKQMCSDITFRSDNDSTIKRVFDWFAAKYPFIKREDFSYTTFHSMNINENFEKFTKSEKYLLVLLGTMTSVAILIAIFGIYSMVALACNRRRKEIAIRKVNGASIKEVFMLFFKQYIWITIVASAVAFPIGVYLMQRWLEQYARRVTMDWRLFAGVFILVLLIVILSMIFRVVKAARENPAEVVKSE